MASTIASLFGPSAEQIVYDRQQAERDRADAEFYRGLQFVDVPGVSTGMVAGRGIARGLGQVAEGLFGGSAQQDPQLARALKLEELFKNTDLSDLSDPSKVAALSNKLAESGMVAEALYFADRAASLSAAAYATDFKERELQAKYGTTKPTDYRVVNEDGSISNVEQRGNRYFNSDTKEEITDFSKIRKANELKPVKEASAAAKLRLRSKFLKDSDFDNKVKDQIAQDIYEKAIRIVNESRGSLEMSEAEQQAYNEMKREGVIVEPSFLQGVGARLNPFSDWQYNPSGSVSQTQADIPTADADQSIKMQQAKERGLQETLTQGATTKQIRQTPDGRVFEILVDADGNITYERELK